jgi:hypothetical protein
MTSIALSRAPDRPRSPHAPSSGTADNVVALLRPGSFVELLDHPDDLPPFQLIQCRGGRCWVRQQTWGLAVEWEVAHRRLRPVA